MSTYPYPVSALPYSAPPVPAPPHPTYWAPPPSHPMYWPQPPYQAQINPGPVAQRPVWGPADRLPPRRTNRVLTLGLIAIGLFTVLPLAILTAPVSVPVAVICGTLVGWPTVGVQIRRWRGR
ncbi:hypothetical protein [Plantactinospora alkalitolerans]|uniref:hypothetical protein n=1 Tax=Plantactinospora alkalitolerans TaxID=2789879 RepID=UPI001E2F0AA6|nr:hypothetical protein [Plantactinospora alkalitolerans]